MCASSSYHISFPTHTTLTTAHITHPSLPLTPTPHLIPGTSLLHTLVQMHCLSDVCTLLLQSNQHIARLVVKAYKKQDGTTIDGKGQLS